MFDFLSMKTPNALFHLPTVYDIPTSLFPTQDILFKKGSQLYILICMLNAFDSHSGDVYILI